MNVETYRLTEWEKIERDGLLARETPELRDKRLKAENQNTTAVELERLTDEAIAAWETEIWHNPNRYGLDYAVGYDFSVSWADSSSRLGEEGFLLAEAILAHPNASPKTLLALLNEICDFYVLPACVLRGVLRNPLAPFLCLETPDFWGRVSNTVCAHLLSKEEIPRSVVSQINRKSAYPFRPPNVNNAVIREYDEPQEMALFHVALEGIIQSQIEWVNGITSFWRAYCADISQSDRSQSDQWFLHEEIVELELAPPWAAGNTYDVLSPVTPATPSCVSDWYNNKAAKESNRLAWWETVSSVLLGRFSRAKLWHELSVPYSSLHKQIALSLLLRPNASSFQLTVLTGTLNSWHENIREIIMAHPKMDASALQSISEDEYAGDIYHRITDHPLTPAEVLVSVLSHTDSGHKHSLARRFACRHPNAPPAIKEYARRALVSAVALNPHHNTPLSRFVATIHDGFSVEAFYWQGESEHWTRRLHAALKLPLSDEPFSHDPWKRSPRQLLHHLAHDGNRFVRWAAQTRLADPDFVFTWADEE